MPSFTALITLAVSFLAFTAPAVMASADGIMDSPAVARDLSFADSVFARHHDVEKRAGNNFGHKCRGNYQCRTNIKGSRPSCSAKGICGFKCLGGLVAKGGKCVPRHHHHHHHNTCHHSRQCPTDVAHAKGVCYHGKCEFACRTGYHKNGDRCVRNHNKCNDSTCYPVQDGYSTCQAGKCSYHCATYLGYTLFTNASKTAYRCVNLEADADNCGELGNVCPTGYNGRGVPTCEVGTCGLDCSGYSKELTLNNQPYCTDN